MSDQKDIFLSGEGDAYFTRNLEKLKGNTSDIDDDMLLNAIDNLGLAPKSVLEIGASNGWRLDVLHSRFSCDAQGVEPSEQAVTDASERYPNIHMHVGAADELKFEDNRFDVVIFGFCLYLCDQSDLFKIVAEADRVLKDGGWILIWDFIPSLSYKNPYNHLDGVYSHKMDHAKLFTAHPAYKLMYRKVEALGASGSVDEHCGVTALQKNVESAFPNNPYQGNT